MARTELAAKVDGFGWVFRPGIGRRIALTMVASLLAVQIQAFLQVWLLSDPQVRLVGTRWLAETTAMVALRTFSTAEAERDALLGQLTHSVPVRLAWSRERPNGKLSDDSRLISARLEATTRQLLGDKARDVSVVSTRLRYHVPFETMRITFDAQTLANSLGSEPIAKGDPEVLLPATLMVAVEGRDGTWVTVSPIAFDSGRYQSLPWMPLIVGGLIIAAVSALLARRIVAPLDRLVAAANSIGTARQLVRIRAEGMHEFAAVATAFEDMQRRLLKFVDDRTQMLAAISHDLRSALTRMRLAIEGCPESTERSGLSAEIDDMQSMVESTLAFATAEGQLAPNQPIDIAAMLISIVDEAGDRGEVCTYLGPDHIIAMGHAVALRRAFRNIVDNALKYGHRADLTLNVGARTVQIFVDDNGPGIAEDAQEDAFAPFRRLDPSRSHRVPGAGLGLTIAKDVIQSHGGAISLTNRQGRGLRVLIELPLRWTALTTGPVSATN